MRRSTTTLMLTALGAVMVGLAIASCTVGSVELAGKACPCADGFVCQPGTNLCVTPDALSDASVTSPTTDGSAGGTDGSKPACPDAGCPCATDVQCTDPVLPKCDNSVCVACTAADDRCAAGHYCNPMNQCTVGCKGDSECMALSPTAPYCNQSRHQCVACKAKADCSGAQECSPAGVCVDACSLEGGTCSGTSACCTGLCVNETSDVFNCNGCGLACTGSKTLCCASSCTDPTTSAQNCGKCGFACSTVNGTPSCALGACGWACSSGYAHCAAGNTGCETNVTNNLQNCGACGRDCNQRVKSATGISCNGTSCNYATCASGHYDCDGDRSNGCESTSSCATCGLIGQLCCAGNVCTQGLCEPAPANDGRCH
jgi:hypothetical protein